MTGGGWFEQWRVHKGDEKEEDSSMNGIGIMKGV